MASNKSRVPSHRESRFRLQHAQGRKRHRHQGRLGIFSELQGLRWAVPYGGRQFLAERGIDLVEDRARRREGFRKRLTHTDGLRTLAGKSECCCHRMSPEFCFPAIVIRLRARREIHIYFQYLVRSPGRMQARPATAACRLRPKDTAQAFPVKPNSTRDPKPFLKADGASSPCH